MMSFWDTKISLPDHEMNLWELILILEDSLNSSELEEIAEDLSIAAERNRRVQYEFEG